MSELSLKDRVREAHKNAVENGYDFIGWTVEEIAVDMITYSADLENESVEDVARALSEIGEE